MDKRLEELCEKIALGRIEDKDLLVLAEAIGEAIEAGKVPIHCGLPVAKAFERRKGREGKKSLGKEDREAFGEKPTEG